MAESCVFKPTVRNKEGKEVYSRLWDSLLHFSSGDREFAKKYYFLGTNEEFLRANAGHIEYDENGEIALKGSIILPIFNELIKDIDRNGLLNGIGKPEPLKHRKACSRRITDEHRLVYNMDSNQNLIIYSCKYHYED